MKLKCPEVRIENTTLCNANCVMCARDTFTRPLQTMDNVSFFKLVDQAKDIGATTIAIYGFGEPLMDKDIVAKVAYVSKHDMVSVVTTNASLLTQAMGLALLGAGLSHLRVSFYAIRPTDYEAIHRNLKYRTVLNNIEGFLRLNGVNGAGVTTHVTACAMSDDTVDDYRKFWESEVDYLEVWKPHNWANTRWYRKPRYEKKRTCILNISIPVECQNSLKRRLKPELI